jgi:hypothetical protein
MKLNSHFIYMLILSCTAIFSSCPKSPKTGCLDPSASNYDPNADLECNSCCTYKPKQGGVLFWSEDPFVIPSCGNVIVKLSNGQQTIITGYYNNPGPSNCVNQVGGYVLMDVGTYNYTVTTSRGCTGGSGTITVTEGCNIFKID